jgi:hypothetical protein
MIEQATLPFSAPIHLSPQNREIAKKFKANNWTLQTWQLGLIVKSSALGRRMNEIRRALGWKASIHCKVTNVGNDKDATYWVDEMARERMEGAIYFS